MFFKKKESNLLLTKKTAVNSDYEICVLCGKKINVHRDTPVDFRDCYVQCCGQLCRDCWNEVMIRGCGETRGQVPVSKIPIISRKRRQVPVPASP